MTTASVIKELMLLAFSEVTLICKHLQEKFVSSRLVVTSFNKLIKLSIIFRLLPNSFLKKLISSCRNLSKQQVDFFKWEFSIFLWWLRGYAVAWWCESGVFFWMFSSWIFSFSISLFTNSIVWGEENGWICCSGIPLFEFSFFSLLLLSIPF